MSGSNFSIINGSDGVMKVPISTPANDVNGNTVVGHLIMTPVAGVATPVDTTHPLSVGVASLPLPAGAATDASLGKLSTALAQIEATLTAPPLPTGAATDATLAKLAPALAQIQATLTAPALAVGAATEATLAKLAPALAQIQATLTAPPLPAGAATNASLATLATALAGLQTTMTALQQSEAPFQGVVPMTLDQAQATQRAVRIVCTTAGTVSLTYADGSKDVIPIAVGLSYIAGAVTTVNSAGTTATATFANMR